MNELQGPGFEGGGCGLIFCFGILASGGAGKVYHTECMGSELNELVGKGAMKVTVLFLRQRAPI